MSHQEEAVAMAFAVLRNRSYRFLAVSPEGVVVSNGSPTLAIDVSRPVGRPPIKAAAPVHKHRRRPYSSSVLIGTGYKDDLLKMERGESHLFPHLAGVPPQRLKVAISNLCNRLLEPGNYSARTTNVGVEVVRK